jgi:hypothetical protein
LTQHSARACHSRPDDQGDDDRQLVVIDELTWLGD